MCLAHIKEHIVDIIETWVMGGSEGTSTQSVFLKQTLNLRGALPSPANASECSEVTLQRKSSGVAWGALSSPANASECKEVT